MAASIFMTYQIYNSSKAFHMAIQTIPSSRYLLLTVTGLSGGQDGFAHLCDVQSGQCLEKLDHGSGT
jgi:hypothetical protein